MRTLLGLLPVLGIVGLTALPASAAEVTRVASSFEDDDPFDLHFGISYDFDYKQAAILREWSSNGNNRLSRDLFFQQRRHSITPSLEIGLYRGLSFYASLPIVVLDQRQYSFDQREGGDCVYAETDNQGSATCVNKTNSTSVRDGIIPVDGFDADNPSGAFNQFTGADTELIFRGPKRRGLDQLHVGLKYALTEQNKQNHLPNWVIGLEGRFAVTRGMSFTRDIANGEPDANRRVGRGIHELGVWTSLSRRYRYVEPYIGGEWRQAFRASGSQFKDFGGAQDNPNPQSTAGLYFGTEIIPWEDKAKSAKVSIMLAGTATFHYNGRAYSEIWEMLADSPALVGDNSPGNGQGCRPAAAVNHALDNPLDPHGYLDAANDATGSGGCSAFNGITSVEDYSTFGLTTALNFHMGPYARLNIGAHLRTDTRHFLTAANRGDPSVAGDSSVVDPDTADVNPVRRDVIDNVGRRYAIDDVFNVVGFANFLLTF